MSSEDPPDSSTTHITLRAPTIPSSPSPSHGPFRAPPTPWLLGTWHVTHSTLPMWKKARNVRISYAALDADSDGASANPKLDDRVTYQSLSSDKEKVISGVDTPAAGRPGSWDWRGNGWLMIASSHWEVLGYGEEPELELEQEQEQEQEQEPGGRWVVTYFAKTLFTPAGLDVYSRRKEGLREETLREIRGALGRVDAEVVRDLAGQMFEVRRD